jgi:hypothetical protein
VTCTHAPGRYLPSPVVREMVRAFGVVTCPDCFQVRGILGRVRVGAPESPSGGGYLSLPAPADGTPGATLP